MYPSLLQIHQNVTHSCDCQQITMQRCYMFGDSYLNVTDVEFTY
jgi:hypothetical protein